MKFLDPQHPFYRPLGVRVAITVFCFAWASWEIASGSVFWAFLFAAFGGVCAWEFFLNSANNFDEPADSVSEGEDKK